MKRTSHRIVNQGPIPKEIRIKTLRTLLKIDYNFSHASAQSGIDYEVMKYNPRKCIDHIMKYFKLSERTAYDYYTTLLQLRHGTDAFADVVFGAEEKFKEKEIGNK